VPFRFTLEAGTWACEWDRNDVRFVADSSVPPYMCRKRGLNTDASVRSQPNYIYCGVRNAVWVYDMRNSTIALPRSGRHTCSTFVRE